MTYFDLDHAKRDRQALLTTRGHTLDPWSLLIGALIALAVVAAFGRL